MPTDKGTVLLTAPQNWRYRKARDIVTGFTGTATAVYTYANSCERVEISGMDKECKPEAYIFDIQQVAWLNTFAEGKEPESEGKPLAKRTGGSQSRTPVAR